MRALAPPWRGEDDNAAPKAHFADVLREVRGAPGGAIVYQHGQVAFRFTTRDAPDGRPLLVIEAV